jgi:elongation factor 1 alpha-like protein
MTLILGIEIDNESVPWAAAGSNVTLYLAGIDPVQLGYTSIGRDPEP